MDSLPQYPAWWFQLLGGGQAKWNPSLLALLLVLDKNSTYLCTEVYDKGLVSMYGLKGVQSQNWMDIENVLQVRERKNHLKKLRESWDQWGIPIFINCEAGEIMCNGSVHLSVSPSVSILTLELSISLGIQNFGNSEWLHFSGQSFLIPPCV